ncbi:MAG TPA: MFS transporter [Acetobacteraceae bacterium]|nr:MFS transporter [Acetobacteraceae bacterium]
MFGLIGPITFVMSLDRTAIVVAAPTIQKEYGFSLVEMGWILTSFSWTYAFLQVPAGWLAERIGPRRALFAANGLWSLLTAATPLGFSVSSFIGIRALLGAGQAADWPASVLALKRWFPASERSRGNSVLLGALYLGPIAAAPLTTWIIFALSWRWAFVFFGAVGLVLGFGWYALFRDTPRAHPRITREEADYIAAGQADGVARVARGATWACLGSVQFWAIGVQYFFLVLIQSFYTTWLPTFLMQDRGFSLRSMGFYASLPWVALFVMVFVTGRLADSVQRRTGSVWRARVPFAIAGFVISALALIAATRLSDVVPMMALLCISLGAIGLTQVSIWSATQDLGGGATGVVSGWTNCWGNSAGFVGPVLTAYLVYWTGSWAGAVLGIAGAGLAGALLWLFVQPQRRIPALEGRASER